MAGVANAAPATSRFAQHSFTSSGASCRKGITVPAIWAWMTGGRSLAYRTSSDISDGKDFSPEAVVWPLPSDGPLSLSDVECAVIHLSRADPLSSLSGPHDLATRLLHWLGPAAPNPLADPHLEALRRYAVLSRLQRQVADSEVDRFLAAGFTRGQAAQVEQMAARWRTRPRRNVDVATWAVLCLTAALSYEIVVRTVDEPLMALMSACLSFLLLAPVLLPTERRR